MSKSLKQSQTFRVYDPFSISTLKKGHIPETSVIFFKDFDTFLYIFFYQSNQLCMYCTTTVTQSTV